VGRERPRARRRLTRGGVKPSSDADPRGVKPSSEAEVSWRGAWPSSEMEVRPRHARGRLFVGPLRLPGPWDDQIGSFSLIPMHKNP
jgi:hypothetical protein